MVVCESSINNIMGGIENTGGVTLHNHRRKLKQRFDIIKKLGQGTYGKVQLGINKETGQEVAIKTIKKCKIETEADLVRIRREIQIMSSVQHPNIIHIYEVFENREKMVLVMEYAAGGELYDYLSERKVLTEDEARRIFRQIATAVYYCHKHKICHRDLKLENILLDENGSAKIADFGLSNVFDDRRLLSTFCGSPLYASPEIVKGTPYHGPEVDCWSLGVLLYTLVYGAMPFDGSNFKRLVKQISQGDYFEPKKPSSASPLIREMLTVIPEKRANIENICAHWWVNANYTESCLEIAEDLANQTPVRLDLLLSLAPPPPPVGTDKLVIAGESSNMVPPVGESSTPARSQSVGSLMELVPSAERRIRDLVSEDQKSPKRKLEVTVSTENANLSNSGAKRKEKPQTETEQPVLTKNMTQTMVKEEPPKPEEAMNDSDPNLQGAACSELIEESNKKKEELKDKEKKKVVKVVKKKAPTSTAAVPETNKDQTESEIKTVDKENKTQETTDENTKIPVKRKTIKKVLTDKTSNVPTEKQKTETKKPEEKPEEVQENKSEEATPPSKPIARRQSKIFETAEKFQNLLQSNDSKSSVLEKPKKIFIPGVNVGGFKKEFERKASLTSPPDVKKVMSKKTVPPSNQTKPDEVLPSNSANDETETENIPTPTKEIVQTPPESNHVNETSEDPKLQERKKNAVDIISNAITKEGTRKSKSRPCMMRKPPVPFGINGRSASGSIGLIPSQFSPTITKSPELSSPDENNVKSAAEITLKSATLPRRKTTKAEIKLDYPPPRPATIEFKTEMAHRIEKPELKTQRSEIIVPVNNNVNNRIRSSSLDPELKPKSVESPKERIIPISFEKDDNIERPEVSSPQAKPPMPKPFPTSRPTQQQRFGSISRQSTHDSDTETTVSENMEPIRKSPREYIIPIAVEGGGYVTPRATSLEPSETGSAMSSGRRSMPRFGRSKRMGEDGSEEDISFASSLHRHNSVGRDSDNEDSRREPFHMHRLRSSRPTRKANLEHADSLSSGEEDDDDGFEILTAENLFSTLLSRVRSLTQRLNVEDNGRLGFPNTRLLGNFDHGSKLWNLHNDTLSRFSPMDRAFREQSTSSVGSRAGAAPWRRSVSRDLATDIERVFNDTPPATATLPRDKSKKPKEANLYDLDLSELKLSDEDAIALSYLTPGLSRRIQSQLLSQLPTARKDKITPKKPKDYAFSDSPTNDSVDEYNFPRPPKHSYSSSRASDYSPIAESPILQDPKLETNHVESKPLNIYRLEDIKKEYNIDKNDNKYTPFKNCYRSTSLVEPPSTASYKNPLYFRNVNYSSESFDSKYSSDKPTSTKYNTINPRTYGLTKHQEDIEDPLPSTRRTSSSSTSRFGLGTTNYYDNCVYSKERKKRELETQKVLKEIRNKRINDHRDKYIPRPAETINHSFENHNHESIKSEKSGDTSSECSTVDKSNKSEEKEEKNIKREGKISKLIRPKSYPTECRTETRPEPKNKIKKRSPSVDKSSPAKDLPTTEGKKQSNNQFLSSIEKKIRSFYSESQPNNEKAKNDVNSRIQSTIRSLREQSEPRNPDHCVTESGLIKRAVSSEDFSVFGSNTKPVKTLQPSRKSVSKILGLFKKYEDKDKPTKENGTTKKNKSSVDGINKKIKTKSDSSTKNKKTPTNTETNDIAKKSSSKLKSLSKLPIRGLGQEPEVLPEKKPSIPVPDLPKLEETIPKPERKDLKLNLTKKTSDFKYRDYNNDISTDNDNSSALFSPCDESNDSWSVCSDLHRQDTSPIGENKLYSEDEGNESVSDRIRRKSFYCRFNEKKKPRKTSLTDYSKFDLKYPEVSSSHHKSSRSSKKYDDPLQKSLSNSSYAYNPNKNDSKLCKRTLSMNDNYYSTYNPKYRESSIPLNNSHSSNDKSNDYNNEKSLTTKPKRSLLKTPNKIRDRMSMSPPLQDFDHFGPSTSNNSVDIPAPM